MTGVSYMGVESGEPEFVRFRGVRISNVDYREAYGVIRHVVETDGKGFVCLNDVGNVIGAFRDAGLRYAINASLLSLADGTPLAWYAKLLECEKIERISGMGLMSRMFAERDGLKHFLLGDTEQRIGRVMAKARDMNDSIRIQGYSPPFKEFDDEDNRRIMERINRETPDVVWVSFGGGKQEKWMHLNLPLLQRGVLVGVGAAFKWMIGDLKQTREIIQKLRLQWTYRITQSLVKEPSSCRKILPRVLERKVIFMWHFPGEVIRNRGTGRSTKSNNDG